MLSKNLLNSYFNIDEAGSTPRKEISAGAVTFFTMAYIIFLQPAILSGSLFGFSTGMSASSVATATILSSFIAAAVMGLYAKLPIALAPGMGENFFFVLTVIPAASALNPDKGWQIALGAVFISGVLFFILSASGARKWIIEAVSPGMKSAIAGGIGLFIALIGLKNGSIIVSSQSTGLALNSDIYGPDALIFFAGLLITITLHARKIPGSILIGIVATTFLAALLKFLLKYSVDITPGGAVSESLLFSRFAIPDAILAVPDMDFSTFFALDISGAFTVSMIPYIFILLFMMAFDTTGTLIAIGERAGIMKNGELPRAGRAFITDAGATVIGALFGTSTVTAYIESTAGVQQGGRTGLTAVTVGFFFLLTLFLSPVIMMIGNYPPVTAPALVMVGAMMIESIQDIDWKDATESVPAFLTLAGIPFTYSISDGIALGLLVYPVMKILTGKYREINPMMIAAAVIVSGYLFILRPAI